VTGRLRPVRLRQSREASLARRGRLAYSTGSSARAAHSVQPASYQRTLR
jgi:hypothetical protein